MGVSEQAVWLWGRERGESKGALLQMLRAQILLGVFHKARAADLEWKREGGGRRKEGSQWETSPSGVLWL